MPTTVAPKFECLHRMRTREAMPIAPCTVKQSSGRTQKCWQGQVVDLVKEVMPLSLKNQTSTCPTTTSVERCEFRAIPSRTGLLCQMSYPCFSMPRYLRHQEFATIRFLRMG